VRTVDEFEMVRIHGAELMRAAAEARLAGELRPAGERSALRAVSRMLRVTAKVWHGGQRRTPVVTR
jgi:hypothetical protein